MQEITLLYNDLITKVPIFSLTWQDRL